MAAVCHHKHVVPHRGPPKAAYVNMRLQVASVFLAAVLTWANARPPLTLRAARRAYVLLSYGARDRQCATIAAALACRDVAPEEDVIILRLGAPIDPLDLPPTIKQRSVDFPVTMENNGGGARFAKFYVAALGRYDSVVFVDYDVFVRRPLNALFDLAEKLPDTLVAPRAYWLKQPYLMSGTFALSRGHLNQTIHNAMMEVTRNPKNKWSYKRWLGDMDWLNSASLRDDVSLVSGFYTLLVGEFYPGDAIYNYWGKRFGWTPARVLKEAPLVHFIAGWKPWGNGIKEAKGRTTPELELVFNEWRRLRRRVCRQ